MTRHLPLAALAAALAAPAFALDCEDGFRPFSHHAGETCVPLDPQRIVTMQDQNALLPLLELGVRPVGSAGHVLEDDSTVFRRTQGYDTGGIAFVGSYRGPADREAVAALAPDLIVVTPFPEEFADQLAPIAPTVTIDMFEQPLSAALMQFADLVGETDRAEELQAEFDAKAAETRDALGDRLAETTVSVVIYDEAGDRFYAVNEVQAWQMLFDALGFPRPAVEEALGTDRVYKSMEAIGEHAADVMILVTFSGDQSVFDANFDAFATHPLVRTLPVAQAGQLFQVDGAEVLGAAWQKPMNGLDAFAAILLRDDLNRDLVAE
jgi:iron complex transport system substrate-binding protein